ncbi:MULTISPECIES: preprotein translocase subunit SecG [unclassified Gilliamella]|uniref:preprotein translocase subunit SecG n=1 Tax=unclassified Gilliamella TaxID=2685620 RepID=UPI002B4754FC|nr:MULTISPECIES: preprotein translocase subunit SecG [unclassified Gilliamella]MCX8595792.1 preprotein translocase subunit SecG [Gilliamella sp. B3493]MCX8597990.1 preprotein translocase subunit SecG [Gilliamella sp. B3486]MCX8688859.1 preprotein translocase subunit SecG [Gilliamella sp. B2973]MCX8703977.1 preprotein translocase subunit SecG [Gilliamella sp. B3127]
MYELLIIGYLIIALAIIVLVLIQRGKGADMGSSFGAGASATLFGSSGSGNFLTRTTTILGVLFFALSIILSNIGSSKTTNISDDFKNIGDNTNTQQSTENSNSNRQVIPTTDPVIQPQSINPTSDIPE